MTFPLPTTVSASLWWAIATVAGALTAGTVVRLIGLRGTVKKAALSDDAAEENAAKELVRKRLASLCSWWIVAIAICLAAVGGLAVAATLLAIVSCLAFRELSRLTRPEPLKGDLRIIGYALIITTYSLLAATANISVLLTAPLVATIVAAAVMAAKYDLASFNSQTSSFTLAIIWTLSLPATAILVSRPSDVAFHGGLFLLLMILTELNDIFSALVGRRLGKRKLAPVISPHKTVEGFLGGVVLTTAVAVVYGSWTTPLSLGSLFLAGLVISLAGTVGDLNMSAIKRCAKVKDSSELLPGQGGILDRIDSLTLSAPAFYLSLQLMVVR